ncbi:MAG: nuclear transport factor 2 family protein [Bacteroidota bacterium]
MKNSIYVLASFFLFACQQKGPYEIKETINEEEAVYALNAWKDAYLTNNIASVDTIVHSSWVYSGSSNGRTSDKGAMLDELRTAGYYFAEIVYDDVETRTYGNTAIVTGREKMLIVDKITLDTTVVRLRFTDVYQKLKGKVQALSTHSSPISE